MNKISDYHIWADYRIIDLLSKINENSFDERYKNLRTLKELIIHHISCYQFMFPPFIMDRYTEFEKELRTYNKDELLDQWKTSLRKMSQQIENHDGSRIQDTYPDGTSIDFDFHEYLDMVSDHSTYHRGQIMLMYKLLTGYEGVTTDLGLFLSQQISEIIIS